MTTIYMVKGTNHHGIDALLPVDEPAQMVLARIKPGQEVRVDVRRSRSIPHHRLFFGLMTLVHGNLPHRYHNAYPTVDSLIDAVKMEVGCFVTFVTFDGEIRRRPGSIAFNKMDQDGFNEFYNRVCDAVVEHFYPGMKSADLKREVEQMTGIRLEAA